MYSAPKAGKEHGWGAVEERLVNPNLCRQYLQSEKYSEM